MPEPYCSRRTPRREARRAGSTRAARYRHYIPLIQRGERSEANLNSHPEESADVWNCTHINVQCKSAMQVYYRVTDRADYQKGASAFTPPLTDPLRSIIGTVPQKHTNANTYQNFDVSRQTLRKEQG